MLQRFLLFCVRATVLRIRITVFADAVIDLLGFFLQLHRTYLIYKLRKLHSFVNLDAVSNRMCLFYKLCQMLISDDLMILVSAENCIV